MPATFTFDAPRSACYESDMNVACLNSLRGRLKRLRLLVMVAMLASPLSAQQSTHALFNHKNLSGWEHVGPGAMVVQDGMMKTEGGMGLLWYSREKLGNVALRIVFKL